MIREKRSRGSGKEVREFDGGIEGDENGGSKVAQGSRGVKSGGRRN